MLKSLSVLSLVLITTSSFSQEPNYDVTVSAVTVWVRIFDKNKNPVKGLAQSDFQIFEEGSEVPITCFEEIGSSSTPGVTREENPPDQVETKRLVLFLDLINTTSAEYKELLPVMQKFLDLIPAGRWELMAIAFTPEGKLRVLVPFTTDLNKIRSLLPQLPANSAKDMQQMRNNSEIEQILRDADSIPEMRQSYLRSACLTAHQFTNDEKQKSEYSLQAFNSFVNDLAAKEPDQQKIILHFSGGVNSDPGRAYFDIIEELSRRWGKESEELYFELPDCRRDLTFHPARDVKKTLTGMNHANVTLYSINARTIYRGTQLIFQNATVMTNEHSILSDYRYFQQQMVEETGGLFFATPKKFLEGFETIVNDIEHQYVVCFKPRDIDEKGKYRSIRVQCKRRDVEIRHRKGYVQ